MEGGSFCDHMIDGDSCRPQIHFFIIASSHEHFRCQILVSTYNGEHIPPNTPLEGPFGDAEINKFEVVCLSVIKYIFRFDISMTSIPVMYVFNGLEKLLQNLLHFLSREEFTVSERVSSFRDGDGKYSITK